MNKKVFFMSIITFVLYTATLYSQKQKQNVSTESLKNQIESVPFIFKGEIIDIQYYLGDEYGNKLPHYYLPNGEIGILYSSAKIKICQILKGENKLKPGTIEIITSNPEQIQPFVTPNEKGDTSLTWLGGICADCPSSLFIDKKFSAIFFCVDAKYTGKSGFQFDNSFGIYPSSLGFSRINNDWIGFKVTEKEFNEIYNSEINSKNSSKENITYSGLKGNIFYSPDECYNFLKEINLNISSFDYCREEEH